MHDARTFRRFQKSAAMKAILLVTALFLSACTSTGTVTPQSVVDWLSTNCGVIVNAADVAALISKDRGGLTPLVAIVRTEMPPHLHERCDLIFPDLPKVL